MSYSLAGKTYPTKTAITAHCREILKATPNGLALDDLSTEFLFELFRHHNEWPQKSADGVRCISTQDTLQGTRCFVLVKKSGTSIDISFPHAIKMIPTYRTPNLLPQGLLDFKNAARMAVQDQIFTFRDEALRSTLFCPITGKSLTRENCHVDHFAPETFDKLVFDFCSSRSINPVNVSVESQNGTVPVFANKSLADDWRTYHHQHAQLRLLSQTGNLQLPKSSVAWSGLGVEAHEPNAPVPG